MPIRGITQRRTGRMAGLIAGAALSLVGLTAAADGPQAGAGEGGKPAGIACQQAGIRTLQSLGLLSAVARNGIEVVGAGRLDFQTVLRLHRTNPELFAGGESAVTVIVPGIGEVFADWCA